MRCIFAASVVLGAVMLGGSSLGQPAGQPAPTQPAAPAHAADITRGNEAFQKQEWAAAVEAYQAALAKGAASRVVHFRLGYALHMLKKYEEALKHHLMGAQLTNKALRVDSLYNAACAHALLGHKAEALKYFQYAIDAGFADTAQVEKDTDLDSLRGDEAFKKMAASIGKTPRLDQQLDFFLGSWQSTDSEGKVTQSITVARPLPGSAALVTTNTNIGGGSWTGLIVPEPASRTWVWTSVDGIGTTLPLTGKAIEPAGVRFEGREASIGGLGATVRITLTPGEDGTVKERAEVSDDGKTWRTHHEETYRRKAAEPKGAEEAVSK